MAVRVNSISGLRDKTSNATPGDEIVVEDGVYEFTSRWRVTNGGKSGNPIVIRGADGAKPVIEFNTGAAGTSDSGVQFRSPYVHFKNFEVRKSTWKGVNMDGNGHDVVLEDLDVHDCNLWGIMNNGHDNVVYRNCDSHDNFDPQNDGEHSDGFNITGPATNCLIEGCRSWNNGDDGYDFWVSEGHTIRDCWAWNNGNGSNGDGNGFKLGGGGDGGGHRVERCVSYNNGRFGFTWNRAENGTEMYNCTGVGNSRANFIFKDTGPHVLKNNISYNGGQEVGSGVEQKTNSWNLGIDNPEFHSTDPSSDDFLRLPSSSPAIDAGTDVGLSYNGSAPDLGAFEMTPEKDTSEPSEAKRSEPSGDGKTANHGYAIPKAGQADWHVPLNENLAAIDRDVPIVDSDGAKGKYDPMNRSLYIAFDTGVIYIGNGSEWTELGTLS